MPKVTIVGGGIAGLSAGLRLVERGFDVTLCEEDDFIGGKLGAHPHPDKYPEDFHEHSYHMYLNWYHNFWQIIDQIGIRDAFVAQHFFTALRRGERPVELKDARSIRDMLSDLTSGAAAMPAMYLYFFSLIDLMATSSAPQTDFDRVSVLSFLLSRGYMTEDAIKLHGCMLAKAFACPTFLSDARTYKKFVNFGVANPNPMMWLCTGNTQQTVFQPFERHLERITEDNRKSGREGSIRICRLNRLKRLELEGRRVRALEFDVLDRSPTIDLGRPVAATSTRTDEVEGDVILAIPVSSLARLVDAEVYRAAPELNDVKRLRSRPMASFDVYFKRKLPDIPKGIVSLFDSTHEMTFLDMSQLWTKPPAGDCTVLNVVVSDFSVFSDWHRQGEIDLIKDLIFDELGEYITFDAEDIDRDRCHLQTNVQEKLFTNEVGSWDFRPGTSCGIENLFVAGDFCKTSIDVVTIEGAVVSGLKAAEAVRQRARVGDPIAIIEPPVYPEIMRQVWRLMGLPSAWMAKGMADTYDKFRTGYREMFPAD